MSDAYERSECPDCKGLFFFSDNESDVKEIHVCVPMVNRLKKENEEIKVIADLLEDALESLVDGLDANTDPERCGLTNEQWQRRIKEAWEILNGASLKLSTVGIRADQP